MSLARSSNIIQRQDPSDVAMKNCYPIVIFLLRSTRYRPQSFDFPVPLAPLSSFVTSVSDVSAFKLTGSPRAEGLFFNFSSAFCFKVLFSPSDLAPVSSGVGFVSEVSALRDTGSPI